MAAGIRSATLVAWANAWFDGRVSYDDVLARATAGDEAHRVVGLESEAAPGWLEDGLSSLDGDMSLGWALGRLRALGVQGLRLVLPVPGDALGLPGPSEFSRAAFEAGEGVVALGGERGLGLVPEVERHDSPWDGCVTSVRWRAYDIDVGCARQLPHLGEAELELYSAVEQTTSRLTALGIARWRPELAGPIQEMRDNARRGRTEGGYLPPGYPTRARRLLVMADQLSTVIELAGQDSGTAVNAYEVGARDEALRQLSRAIRRARIAAYNDYASDPADMS